MTDQKTFKTNPDFVEPFCTYCGGHIGRHDKERGYACPASSEEGEANWKKHCARA